jgi:transposase
MKKWPAPTVRTRQPVRGQVEMKLTSIDDLVPRDHIVRGLDAVAHKLDLSPLKRRAKVVGSVGGRPLSSPEMLLTLWLYAVLRGVGSAREIERLTKSDNAFAWIVGDLTPSHDVIAAFRVDNGDAFSGLLTDVLGSLLEQGLLDLDVVGQDGTRIRASAGSGSFRSAGALADCCDHARRHLAAVLNNCDDEELSQKARVATEAKARDYAERVEKAAEIVTTLRRKTGEPRVSTTDVDARIMKMPDGGFRPGYNFQFAVAGKKTGGPRSIVGVRVTNLGSDQASVIPMLDDVTSRLAGRTPKAVVADTNHLRMVDVEEAHRRGVFLVAPLPRSRKAPTIQQIKRDEAESEVLKVWRVKMTHPSTKQLYRQRSALCEFANAALKGTRRLDRLWVRGLPAVTAVAYLFSLAFTIQQNIKSLL